MMFRAWNAAVTALILAVSIHTAIAADSSPAEQISEFRLKHGEVRVARDATLDRIAAEQARAMAEKDDLSHEVLGPFTRRVAPSKAGRAAENIAYGYETFDKTLGQWTNSPPHRKNLLLHNATKVGIASARNASGKRTYWAMVIAGDYETKPPVKKNDKGKPDKNKNDKGKPAVVAQAKSTGKSETKTETKSEAAHKWGASPKECHLNIKLLGLCI
nr:CAP domain-containing protein [Bradyrhizobium sp. SZCCHNS2096]